MNDIREVITITEPTVTNANPSSVIWSFCERLHWVSRRNYSVICLGGWFRAKKQTDQSSDSSVFLLSHGYFPKNAANKKMNPAKKLAKVITPK